MFKLAVLGPIIASGFGLSRQCIECARRQAPGQEPQCRGFEAGCLGYGPLRAADAPTDHRAVRGARGLMRK